jgi:ribosomal protein L6P/L9E
MLSKTFIIPFQFNVKLFITKKFQLVVINTLQSKKKYFLLSKKISIEKHKKKLKISVPSHKTTLNYFLYFNFFKKLISQFRSLKKKNFKTLLIRGVGLKVSFLETNSNILQLKLGLSHLIFLTIPNSIKILILKRKMIISGNNSIEVGNFSKKVMSFKKIDSFTGKGLWLKNIQKFYCKPVKKR